MNNISYSNINLDFTFENVCSKLTTFWLNEVMTLNKSKVWLTITVFNKNNRSFTLLKNLPFSTSEYTDVVIVLRQIFKTNILSNRQDTLDKIVFEYYFEEKKSIRSSSSRFKNILINLILILSAIILSFLTLIIFLEISQIFFSDIIDEEIINNISNNISSIANENSELYKANTELTLKRTFIFQPFIDLFHCKTCSSYFIPLKPKEEIPLFNIPEYVLYNQYMILDGKTTEYNQNIKEMCEIVERYHRLFEQYEIITANLMK